MSININTQGWSTSNTIPDGAYSAALERIEQTTSRSGNPMLVWYWVVVDCDQAGYEVRDYTVLLQSSAWKLDQVLQALGLGKVGQESDIALEYDAYVNLLAQLVLTVDTYTDQSGAERERMVIGRVAAHPDGIGKRWGSDTPGETGASIGVPGKDRKDDASEEF